MSPSSTAGPVDRFFELSLLGLLASGYLAVAGSGYLDTSTALMAGLALLLRLLMTLGVARITPSPHIVLAVTIAYIGFYPLDYLFVSRSFLTATVHLIFFLATVQLLTAHSNRHYFFLQVLALMELLAATILSGNLSFLPFLGLFLLCGVANLAAAEVRRSAQRTPHVVRVGLRMFPWRLTALAVCVCTGVLLLTVGLFFLLPRTAQAAFRHLVPQRYHLAGFSSEVTLGQIGEIKRSERAVMHVRLVDSPEPDQSLKWRGMALSQFDGRRWYNPPDLGELLPVEHGILKLADVRQRWRRGDRIKYEVRMQGLDADTLFFAGVPELVYLNALRVVRTPWDSYRLTHGWSGGASYMAYSYLPRDTGAEDDVDPLPANLRQGYLQLPPLDGRIATLARAVTQNQTDGRGKAGAIERYLRREYRYSLQMLSREVPDPLAYFLFNRKQGHCEYFASAMAVMLRTIGIPSRVVTGFQGGVYNPLSGWQVVRAADAHSWVEAYLPDRGWRTFDPTPPDLNPVAPSVFTRLSLYLDAVDTFWQEWVLQYDLDRQLTLASRMEQSRRQWNFSWWTDATEWSHVWRDRLTAQAQQSGLWWIAGLALVVGLGAGLPRGRRWWSDWARGRRLRQGTAVRHDATILYARMLAVLHRRGFEKPNWLTPNEFVQVLPASEMSRVVGEITVAYNELRYGGRSEAAVRLAGLVEELEQLR